ncbi:hypothetical protein [Corynebacterium caspium]|uniref:hypothetical protein n=1 Tax=Corynebacterium caspium TaxID=234828 RepID=UPI00058DE341|nr:hypothetical protein [Corynebacterium caspium]
MLAVHARFRGRSSRRAEIVRNSAGALSRIDGVEPFQILGVEDVRTTVDSPTALCNLVMALLSDGQWAIGIGIGPLDAKELTLEAASVAIDGRWRARHVAVFPVNLDQSPHLYQEQQQLAKNIAATFTLLGHVLAKRTMEGRQATSLVRQGLTQKQAAAQLRITKQAMSQRLQAAGWPAENQGWELAHNLISTSERIAGQISKAPGS